MEITEMQTTFSNNIIPVMQREMQKVAATIVEDVERRLQASETRMMQAVGAEFMRLKAERETAFTAMATHMANTVERQRMLEENFNIQMAALA